MIDIFLFSIFTNNCRCWRHQMSHCHCLSSIYYFFCWVLFERQRSYCKHCARCVDSPKSRYNQARNDCLVEVISLNLSLTLNLSLSLSLTDHILPPSWIVTRWRTQAPWRISVVKWQYATTSRSYSRRSALFQTWYETNSSNFSFFVFRFCCFCFCREQRSWIFRTMSSHVLNFLLFYWRSSRRSLSQIFNS